MPHDKTLTVGEFSRVSGLPVSALRYYDAAGVLPPAQVDPVSGYRRYTPDQLEHALLVAALRRARMPLADITHALAADPVTARRIVDAHQRHLDAEFAAATAHLDGARRHLSATTSLTVDAGALRVALRAVRHAVGEHPAWQSLHGVLFDVVGTALRLVATDRHRLALSTVSEVETAGPPVRVVVPSAVVDGFLGGDAPGQVSVTLSAQHVTLGDDEGTPVEAVYPDYESLITRHWRQPVNARTDSRSRAGEPVVVNAPDLLARVAPEKHSPMSPRELVHLRLDSGALRIGDAERGIAFDRSYVADAVRSFGATDVRLALGRRDTLGLATVHTQSTLALLMPVRVGAA
ncbi:DNA polymerase III subunit beta family protein [Myceligenerans indicum]|uniref:MerR family transcriptional regulator n=1 Tax=Myceligenerans indicum TaxID=2593663 RepID=A0ABS1LG04_9MICO|nr:MerR family transcriptional regulator [Myceligenerans indicum]MBL0885160.1 MerR family transcriptional regulator [Myceligenerans indicum]